jgi:hypothetical protein
MSAVLTFQTYDIPIFNHSTYTSLLHQWRRPGGDRDTLLACRRALHNNGSTSACDDFIMSFYAAWDMATYGKVDSYDITQPHENFFPPPYMHGYLTEESVLRALGVPVNFTFISWPVNTVFSVGTYDVLRGGFVENMVRLLDGGVKVHMVYGDRDFACNWFSGESASLSIPHSRSSLFSSAGYAPLLVPSSSESSPETHHAGFTRQYANLSFTRVFQAGHEVPSFQPLASYAVFMRAMFDKDVATGTVPVTDDLQTVGLSDIRGVKNKDVPERRKGKCYVLKRKTCTEEEWEGVVNGTAVVRDWVVVGFESQSGSVKGGKVEAVEWKDL